MEDIKVFLFIFVSVFAMIFTIDYVNNYQCRKYQDTTGRKTKWVLLDDCYISTNKGWFSKKEYLATITAKELNVNEN